MRRWNVSVRNWPVSLAGLRIGHVSDFHFRGSTRTTRHAQHLLQTLEYDLLLVTGDFGNFHRHWVHAAQVTREFFDPLTGKAPTFAVLGNHDHPRFPTADGLPLTFLRDQVAQVSLRGTKINIAGVEQTVPRGGDLHGTLSQADATAPTILLAHYPSTAFQLTGRNVQLVLSGHTHGGQIRLPWMGCIWPNDRVPRKMASGLHLVNDVHVHVSAGLGVSLPIRVRINCPPEIAIITMHRKTESRP